MSQLSDKHLPAMLRAAQSAGIPLGELKPLNPDTQQGPRALALITALEMDDPAALAEMRQEAGERWAKTKQKLIAREEERRRRESAGRWLISR